MFFFVIKPTDRDSCWLRSEGSNVRVYDFDFVHYRFVLCWTQIVYFFTQSLFSSFLQVSRSILLFQEWCILVNLLAFACLQCRLYSPSSWNLSMPTLFIPCGCLPQPQILMWLHKSDLEACIMHGHIMSPSPARLHLHWIIHESRLHCGFSALGPCEEINCMLRSWC